jgi:hypothetical protein
MFWSLAPLVLACVILAGLVGTCSFQPKGPAPGRAPGYDAAVALQADANTLNFPVRLPKVPDGWQANSGDRAGIEAGRTDPQTGQKIRAVTSRVGYIAPSGMYVSVTQSNADETALVGSIYRGMHPTGVEDVDGVKWVVYEGGEGTEPVWTTRLDGPGGGPASTEQVAITGSGPSEDFHTLAAATQGQQPLVPVR